MQMSKVTKWQTDKVVVFYTHKMPYRLIERSGGSLWLKLLPARGEPKFPGVRNGSSQKWKKFADFPKKVAEKFGSFENN